MVGIVVVSHYDKLAQGVVELARLMAPKAPIVGAGGMDQGEFGVSSEKISSAIDEIYTEEGVIVLMDMGSAVMKTEKVIKSKTGKKIRMVDCPVAEGAVAAAVLSGEGAPFEDVLYAAQSSKTLQKF